MTGYPPELLDLDLDLEADLGVDTVKQAEVFAAVRERFGVERDDTLPLRDFPTLAHVIGWIRDKTGIQPGEPRCRRAATADAGRERPRRRATLRSTVARRPRRRRPDPAAGARAGAAPGARPVPADRRHARPRAPRVVVMRDEGGVARRARRPAGRGRCRPCSRLEPGTAYRRPCSTRSTAWRADGPVTGVYWLAALDDEGPLEALDLAGWREALRRRVKALYATMRGCTTTARSWSRAPGWAGTTATTTPAPPRRWAAR